MRSVWRALWKQRLLVCVLWLGGTAMAVAVLQLVPAVYRAEAVIGVESHRPGSQSTNGNADAELRSLLRAQRDRVLGRAQLLALAREFGLYASELPRRPEDEIVEMTGRDIDVVLDRLWSRDRPGAFRVAFLAPDPRVAATVANRLAALFIEDNATERDLEGVGGSEFLQDQVGQARKRLQDQETRRSDFRTKYAGQLPQQENALLAELGRLQLQLQGVQDSINRTQQNKVLAETMLAAAQEAERSAAAAADKPNAPDPFEEAARKEADRLQKQLEALRLRYTDEHPEVRHTRQLLARVWNWRQKGSPASQPQAGKEAGVAPTAASASGTVSQSTLGEKERVESLQAQRNLAANQLAALETERKRVVEQIGSVQAGISKLPVQEQELIALNRDYEIARSNYQFLLDKSLAARVSTEIEKRQKPERYSLLEAAKTPQRPLGPDRRLLSALGAALGLLLGVGVGLGAEARRGVLLGEWELPAEVVILGRVPKIREKARAGGARRLGGKTGRLIVPGASLIVACGLWVQSSFRWIPI